MEEGIEKDEMGRKFIYSDTGVKVFVDFKDNLIVDLDDPIIASQTRNWRYSKGIVKGLSYLGSENSEDAMTWNVFKTLEKSNPFVSAQKQSANGKDQLQLFDIVDLLHSRTDLLV
jgi:hypothetical protein